MVRCNLVPRVRLWFHGDLEGMFSMGAELFGERWRARLSLADVSSGHFHAKMLVAAVNFVYPTKLGFHSKSLLGSGRLHLGLRLIWGRILKSAFQVPGSKSESTSCPRKSNSARSVSSQFCSCTINEISISWVVTINLFNGNHRHHP